MVWAAGKAKRLKEAKTQADAEIEQYRNECDAAFRKTEAAVRASVPFSYLSLTILHTSSCLVPAEPSFILLVKSFMFLNPVDHCCATA
jgi:hypothetical protein